ncbi:RNA polymerase sigma factor SigI [Paenibacillus eucommiae]|uniref:RNA polymerase sigma factor SigI n=1 Tax=Paenibacillus eucommiae TaxID=1355755 RepID=A0ABS4J155_9BACL|nr:RNA polymerase sigma factor SigI [Paenibacillus eucommiae]MBP1993572.1 RNA polymerase sigma factor [Paenibacillus eucommiae]
MLLIVFKKFLGKRQATPGSSSSPSQPEELVLLIQQGDLRLRNQFIADYQPYVAKVTSRFCKRYIDPTRDDEFSIALAAFNEAIHQFSAPMGRSFLGFAETVMRRRLIDHLRKEQRFRGQIPYSSFEQEDEDNNVINPIEVHQAIEHYEKQKGIEERQNEIIDFSRSLAEFDIAFSELAAASPKHDDSRQMLFTIGRSLARDSDLMQVLLTKKQLPIKELLERVKVSRKTLERNRKFLIAIAIIHNGSYPYLRDYLQVREED